MKRMGIWILVLLMTLAILPVASAIDIFQPSFVYPIDEYGEPLPEVSKEDEDLVFDGLNASNDEATLVEEYGSVVLDVINVSGELEVTSTMQIVLMDSEYGRIVKMTYSDMDMQVYASEKYDYVLFGVDAQRQESLIGEMFNDYWESFAFPYVPRGKLITGTVDSNNSIYLLVEGNDGRGFEYVAGPDKRMLELRIYQNMQTDAGPTLCQLVRFDTAPAEEIPEAIAQMMREDAEFIKEA